VTTGARRALVTGAGGFIGRHLVRLLASSGPGSVVALDLHPFDAPDGVEAVVADAAQDGVLASRADENTTIYHLAANANIARSSAEPEADLSETFLSTFRALHAARASGARIVFTSSVAVIDTVNDLPLTERSFPRPTSPYGAAKLAGEAYCYAFHRTYGVDARVARLFNVYGAGMRQFVIYDLIRKIQADPNKLTLLGDGQQMRDYVYVTDAVRALQLIGERGEAGGDYNLSSGTPTRIFDLARTIAGLMGHADIDIVTTGESWPGDIPRWYGDNSRLRALGWEQTVDLETGLKKTVEFLAT
jgi:UDP-glucose 4-epimerase